MVGRDSLGSVLSESSTSDEEKRRSGSNERVSPEGHDLTMVRSTVENQSRLVVLIFHTKKYVLGEMVIWDYSIQITLYICLYQ